MDNNTKFNLISVAYRSRFIFRTDAEFRQAVGVSFETVLNNRSSNRDLDVYSGIIDRETRRCVGRDFEGLMLDYIRASDLYLPLDWGTRSQMASRKRFCRMLFRYAATAGKRLSADEASRFKPKDDDRRLLHTFFPDGFDKEPTVDIGLILLFAFGVVRPWNPDNTRSHDIPDSRALDALEKLRLLLLCLMDDLPRLGSTEKPMVFTEWLNVIKIALSDPDDLSIVCPMWLNLCLSEILAACRSLMIAEQQRSSGEKLQGLDMPGIWIDNSDRGRSRFWVFPDNLNMAFCYRRSGLSWELLPYEFTFRFADDDDGPDIFILLAPEGNVSHALYPDRPIQPGQLASGACDGEFDSKSGELTLITLHDDLRCFPSWMDWTAWERLPADGGGDDGGGGGEAHSEFLSVLRAIYNPDSPHSLLFRNTAPEITDSINNLLGHDRKYLYVYDWQPRRYRLRLKGERFVYEADSPSPLNDKSVFELELSDSHPLYAIPMRMKKKTYGGSVPLDRFVEMLNDAENFDSIAIIHSPRVGHPMLAIPTYGVVISLDPDTLDRLGIIKHTSRPDK